MWLVFLIPLCLVIFYHWINSFTYFAIIWIFDFIIIQNLQYINPQEIIIALDFNLFNVENSQRAISSLFLLKLTNYRLCRALIEIFSPPYRSEFPFKSTKSIINIIIEQALLVLSNTFQEPNARIDWKKLYLKYKFQSQQS